MRLSDPVSPTWLLVGAAAVVAVTATMLIRGGEAPPPTRQTDTASVDVAPEIETHAAVDVDRERSACHSYFESKQYDEAAKACGVAIAHSPGDMKLRYWRGAAYRETGKGDLAAPDLTAVAGSGDSFRGYAAIELSMVYFDRNDIESALGVLNKYTYLYNKDIDGGIHMAVAYNNRCYAYMQLGELKKALDDCRASLKYGNLPDAVQKEQLLRQRLHDQGLGL